jgi:hypothetical protein
MPPKNANSRRARSTRRLLITETLETRTLLSALPNPSVAPFPTIAKVAIPALGGGANQPSVAMTGLSGDLNAIQDLTVQATSATGAFVSFPTIVASDFVDLNDPLVVTPGSGSFFPVGSTTVTCVSTDKSGNTATATFQVNVLPAHLAPPTVAPTGFLATRQGIHQLVLRFSEPMNAIQAAMSTQYRMALGFLQAFSQQGFMKSTNPPKSSHASLFN